MTPERWQKIEAVFIEADSVPTGERPAVLDRLCTGDAELRREVEQLLSEETTDTSINSSIRATVSEAFDPLGYTRSATSDQRFGRYRLVRRIGQGGMGAVFEANRVDDFQKKVALKIIKQEFDSDFARARFQQERPRARDTCRSPSTTNLVSLLISGGCYDMRTYMRRMSSSTISSLPTSRSFVKIRRTGRQCAATSSTFAMNMDFPIATRTSGYCPKPSFRHWHPSSTKTRRISSLKLHREPRAAAASGSARKRARAKLS